MNGKFTRKKSEYRTLTSNSLQKTVVEYHHVKFNIVSNSGTMCIPEAGTEVDRHIPMSLFETIVLAHIVQVVSSHYNRPLHFQLEDDRGQDSPSDGNISSEGAFFVDVGAFNRLEKA